MEKINTMIFAIMSYFLVITLVFFLIGRKKKAFFDFPKMTLNKYGIVFYSESRHRIRIENARVLQVKNQIYIKSGKKIVIIKNATAPYLAKGYLYFKACGETKVIFNCKSIYRYFNIMIESSFFDLAKLKQNAIKDLLDNLFDIGKSAELNKYLHLIINILNIKIDEKDIVIGQNRYNLPFILTYKVKNVIKRVKIDQIV